MVGKENMRTMILSESRRKELNRNLAIWAGFESLVTKSAVSNFVIEYWCLKGQKERGSFVFDFPNSLSNCYEWLVPKMKNCSLISAKDDNHVVKITLEDGSKSELSSDSAPMALCLALEKLIVANNGRKDN